MWKLHHEKSSRGHFHFIIFFCLLWDFIFKIIWHKRIEIRSRAMLKKNIFYGDKSIRLIFQLFAWSFACLTLINQRLQAAAASRFFLKVKTLFVCSLIFSIHEQLGKSTDEKLLRIGKNSKENPRQIIQLISHAERHWNLDNYKVQKYSV